MRTDNALSAEDIARAYKKARLRFVGVSLLKALESPLIYKSLVLQANAMRNEEQQQQSGAVQPQPQVGH